MKVFKPLARGCDGPDRLKGYETMKGSIMTESQVLTRNLIVRTLPGERFTP